MSLKQRLRNAERKMGTADDEPVEFQTLYENEDGSADEVSRLVLLPGSGRIFQATREPGETQDQFEARVQHAFKNIGKAMQLRCLWRQRRALDEHQAPR